MKQTSFTLSLLGALVALGACTTVSHQPAPVDVRPYQAAQSQPANASPVYWAGEARQPVVVQPGDYQRPAQQPVTRTASVDPRYGEPGTVVSRRVIREGDYLPQIEMGGDEPEPQPQVTYRFPAEEQRRAQPVEAVTPYSPEYRWTPYENGDGAFVAAQPLPVAPAGALPSGDGLAGAPNSFGSQNAMAPQTRAPAPPEAAPAWAHTQAVSQPDPQRTGMITVKQGDTLYSLAQHHRVSLAALMQANDLSEGAIIRIGQTLVVPGNNAITVQPGDTLYAIGRRLSIDPRSLAIFNGLAAPYTLYPGQILYVPAIIAETSEFQRAVASTPQAVQPVIPPSNPASGRGPVTLQPAPVQPEPQPAIAAGTIRDGFMWPVSGGAIVQGFGSQGQGTQNDGINIAVPVGTDVRAARDGEVSYTGDEIRGYGRLILVTHDDGYVSAYAHLSEYLVREKTRVKAGQVIARSGQTGAVGSPQLHFEIRQRGVAINPLTKLADRNS